MLTRVHHVGIVVRNLEEGLAFWQDTLGLSVSVQATVQDQGVKAALLPIGHSEIELLEPINTTSGVAKFLEKRGGGLHHVCFETPDVTAELAAAKVKGLPLIDEVPRAGLAGTICFLHPKGTGGVLVEFATPPPGSHAHGPYGRGATQGLTLAEVTCRSKDATAAATVYATQLGLAKSSGHDAVTVGGVQLCFVNADTSGEGIGGLVLELDDLAAAEGALSSFAPRKTARGFHLDPTRCHNTPLAFR